MTPDRLAAFFEQHRPHLHEVARAIVGTRADADDVLQDAWVKAAAGWNDAIRSPAAWITTMVRNLALDQRRHRRVVERFVRHEAEVRDAAVRHAGFGNDQVRHVPSVEDALVQRLEAAAAVRRIVEALDRDDAAALLLQVVFDEDHATLARRTGRSAGAMRVALHRARRRVRDGSVERRDLDHEAIDRTFAVCWQAIVAHDAAPLYAVLATAQPANASLCGDAVPAVRVACVQVAGRYVLALRQGDRLISVLPIGVLTPSHADAVD